MPDLADDLMAEIDDDLLAVPALDDLAEVDLLQILHNTPPALKALHGYEALAGALLHADRVRRCRHPRARRRARGVNDATGAPAASAMTCSRRRRSRWP